MSTFDNQHLQIISGVSHGIGLPACPHWVTEGHLPRTRWKLRGGTRVTPQGNCMLCQHLFIAPSPKPDSRSLHLIRAGSHFDPLPYPGLSLRLARPASRSGGRAPRTPSHDPGHWQRLPGARRALQQPGHGASPWQLWQHPLQRLQKAASLPAPRRAFGCLLQAGGAQRVN